MANKAKQKGTAFETATKKYLEEHGFQARRTALTGAKDVGDLEIVEPFLAIVENKAYKGELTESQEVEFRKQTEVEAVNYKETFRIDKDVKGLFFVKTPGQSIARTKVSFFNTRYNCWMSVKLYEFVEHWKNFIDDIR